MVELKRAQELRVDEFSEKKIESKSWNDREAYFTNTRVAREGELHGWFRRTARERIELQWKMFSRSRSTGSCSKSTINAEPPPKHATWDMEFVWNTGKRFWQSTFHVPFITDTSPRNSSPYESKCHRCIPSAGKCRETCRERWRTNSEHNTNADVSRKAVNHEFLLTSGNSTEFYGCTAKTANIGSSVRQIIHKFKVFMSEEKIQNPGEFLFRFPSEGM